MKVAPIALAGTIALSCLTFAVPAQASRADEISGEASVAQAATTQAAITAARVFAQASALMARMVDERTADAPIRRFADAEAEAEARALRQLGTGGNRVAANEQAPLAPDIIRTGRSVATDRPRTAETPPSFAGDLPVIVVGLQQLSGEWNGSFDRDYKAFEAVLLCRLAGAFAAVGRTAEDPVARATAEAEVDRLGAAQAELAAL